MPLKDLKNIKIYFIDRKYSRDSFDCGIFELNEFLKKYAVQNHKKGIAKTFVALLENGDNRVVGYYSVSMAQVEFSSLPDGYQKKLPHYPIPAMRIGRLAVDKGMQKMGLGEKLLIDALYRALNLFPHVGIFSVIVDAKNEKAVRFYEKYKFIRFQDKKFSLFLPVKTILDAFK